MVVSFSGEIMYMNFVFECFIGARECELIDRPADDLSPSEDVEVIQVAIVELFANRIENM